MTIHATAVAFEGHALLLLGPSGSGKSDLALRLIEAGGVLVADDRVMAEPDGQGGLLLSSPTPIAGRMEVRGIGLVRLPHAPALAALALDLGRPPERMPAPDQISISGVTLPLLGFMPFEASAVPKARMALSYALEGRLWCNDDW